MNYEEANKKPDRIPQLKTIEIIENGGVIIRIPASTINVYKRDVKGVIVMRIEEGNQLMSVQRVAKTEEEEVSE